jgi:NTP pyrophosphatase (non-canonical NTP hydrolase)
MGSYHDYILEQTRKDRIAQELMVITAEESGELVQRCMKVVRGGFSDKNRDNLLEEVGDVLCMIELMVEHELLTNDEIRARVEVKRNKLKKWSSLIND